MRIVTWNVNGLKARIASGFLNFVAEASPTILCLQELKVIRMDNPVLTLPPFPHSIYNLYTTLPAYSDTAIVTKLEPMNIRFSCDIEQRVRKTVKGKNVSPTEAALFKALYLAVNEAEKR